MQPSKMLFIFFGALGLAVNFFSSEVRRLVCLRNDAPVVWGEFLDAGIMFLVAAFAWWRLRKTVLLQAIQQRLLRWCVSPLVVVVWAAAGAVLEPYLIRRLTKNGLWDSGIELEWVLLIALSPYAIIAVLAMVGAN